MQFSIQYISSWEKIYHFIFVAAQNPKNGFSLLLRENLAFASDLESICKQHFSTSPSKCSLFEKKDVFCKQTAENASKFSKS